MIFDQFAQEGRVFILEQPVVTQTRAYEYLLDAGYGAHLPEQFYKLGMIGLGGGAYLREKALPVGAGATL